VGDHFCNLVAQEAKALSIHLGSSNSIAWKSVVAGVREMCDVCETTLFNIHWVCSECGFVVCIDCYKTRRDEEEKTKENMSLNRVKTSNGSSNLKSNESNKSGENNNNPSDNNNLDDQGERKDESVSLSSSSTPSTQKNHQETKHHHQSHGSSRDTDRFDWLHCNSKQPHDQDMLMLTQIIAKTALWDVCAKLHDIKKKRGNPCTCNNDQIVNLLVNRSYSNKNKSTIKEVEINNKTKASSLDSKSNIIVKEENLDVKSEMSHAKDPSSSISVKKEPPSSTTEVGPLSTESPADARPSMQVVKSCEVPLPAAKDIKTEEEEEDVTVKNFSALRELLSKSTPEKTTEQPTSGSSSSCSPSLTPNNVSGKKGRCGKKPPVLATQLNGVIKNNDDQNEPSLQFFTRRITPIFTSKNLPPRVCTLEETSKEFPYIPHDWLCGGRLLLLKDTGIEKNLRLFEQQWIRHQVSNFFYLKKLSV
jgi:hypothetical protein